MTRTASPAVRSSMDGTWSRRIVSRERIGGRTQFHRGLGDTGTRVSRIEHERGCPQCGTTELIMAENLRPDGPNAFEVFCTNVACRHFVGDSVEGDMDTIRADEPRIADLPATCPECDANHRVEVDTESEHDMRNVVEHPDSGGKLVNTICDDCMA